MKRLLIIFFAIGVLCLSAANSVYAQWTTLSQANERRYEMITALHDGKLVVVNGFNQRIELVNSVEIYDPTDNSWTLVNTTEVGLENAVTHAGNVLVGDDLWIIGGRVGDHPGAVTNKVWIYNITHNNWRAGPDLPAPFAGGGAGFVNGNIHLFGGLDTRGRCDVDHHFVYDTQGGGEWLDISDTAPMPMARNHFSTAVYKNKIYALGGQNNHDPCSKGPTSLVSVAHVFDPVSSTWSRLRDLPFGRSHSEPATFVYNDRIFIVGGKTDGEKVISYHPGTDEWTVEADLELPHTIMAPAARIINNRLYVAMGGERLHTNASSAMRVLEIPERLLITEESVTDESISNSNIPTPITPQAWTDSYSVDGQCYCDSEFDHGVGDLLYDTPVGQKPVKQICADIESKLGFGNETGRIYYNTVQCGHDPVNLHRINDEWICPGIPIGVRNYTGDRCFESGARWNLEKIYDPAVLGTQTEEQTPGELLTDNELPVLVVEPEPVNHPVEVSAPSPTDDLQVIYRVNAGGPTISDPTGDWQAGETVTDYVDAGVTWARTVGVDVSGLDVAVPSLLFDTERSNRREGVVHWRLPVTEGEYKVRLYFAETYHGNRYVGARVFDVFVENESLTDLDIYSEVKGDAPLVKEFDVVSDELLDIRLTRKVQNPSIKGFEILRVAGSALIEEHAIVFPEEADVVSQAPSTTETVEVAESVQNSLPETAEVADQIDNPLPETVEELIVAADTEINAVSVTTPDSVPVPTPDVTDAGNDSETSTVYRINAGGPKVSFEGIEWQADNKGHQYVNTGKSWSNPVQIDTSGVPSYVPASLFTTERWDHREGDELKWKLPVEPGRYIVNLYFSEIWKGAMKKNGRVFDVKVEDHELLKLDVYTDAGGNTALQKTFVVDADNYLNIEFERQIQNPAIKAIEVIAFGEQPASVVSPALSPVFQEPVDSVPEQSSTDDNPEETENPQLQTAHSVNEIEVVAIDEMLADEETPVSSPVVAEPIDSMSEPSNLNENTTETENSDLQVNPSVEEEDLKLDAVSAEQPLSIVNTDPSHCLAYGDGLANAKRNYGASCSLPRVDCDPVGGGVWACSSSSL